MARLLMRNLESHPHVLENVVLGLVTAPVAVDN